MKSIKQILNNLEQKSIDDMLDKFQNNKISIFSKGYFEKVLKENNINDSNVETFENYTFISILNTDDVGDNIGHFKENHSNVIVLKFDDISEDLEFKPGKYAKVINEEQANELINFITKNEDRIKNGNSIIHCSAGVSRSGAVGTFINDYFNFDYKKFKENNPNIQPNPEVLRILKKLTIYKDYK